MLRHKRISAIWPNSVWDEQVPVQQRCLIARSRAVELPLRSHKPHPPGAIADPTSPRTVQILTGQGSTELGTVNPGLMQLDSHCESRLDTRCLAFRRRSSAVMWLLGLALRSCDNYSAPIDLDSHRRWNTCGSTPVEPSSTAAGKPSPVGLFASCARCHTADGEPHIRTYQTSSL